ncbi:hypothetical protein KY284_011406 [Solanum tuberosum]|nr:hypothetical protein KY284_011406 [Solanum tuberosum]
MFGVIFSQAAPIVAGVAIVPAPYVSRYEVQAWQSFKVRPPTARMRKFYGGDFQPKMSRMKAALILGVSLKVCRKQSPYPHKESTEAHRVREAHKKVTVANHPDAGGNHYLASKIKEAKDTLLGKTENSGSAF